MFVAFEKDGSRPEDVDRVVLINPNLVTHLVACTCGNECCFVGGPNVFVNCCPAEVAVKLAAGRAGPGTPGSEIYYVPHGSNHE